MKSEYFFVKECHSLKPESVNRSLISISKWGKATGILFIIIGSIFTIACNMISDKKSTTSEDEISIN